MTDHALELAIERAGRERVFIRAQETGWSHNSSPPKWVWWEIIRMIEAEPR